MSSDELSKLYQLYKDGALTEAEFNEQKKRLLGGASEAITADGAQPYQAMSFGASISTCFEKFFTFGGRASRPEFWWFYLFSVLMSWGADVATGSAMGPNSDMAAIIQVILGLVFFFPTLAVSTRRLHDVGRSGWWQLLYLTVIGIIVLIIWWASKGETKENQYGPPIYT